MIETPSFFEISVSIAAAVILFVYALKHFSRDVQEAGGDQLNRWLQTLTKNPFKGFLLGAGLTAVIQSSSAVRTSMRSPVDCSNSCLVIEAPKSKRSLITGARSGFRLVIQSPKDCHAS